MGKPGQRRRRRLDCGDGDPFEKPCLSRQVRNRISAGKGVEPLEMEYGGSWSVNGDQNGLEKLESGINARAIDFAKFGRLMLNDGQWEGKRIVSQGWVERATQPEEKSASYY